MCSSAAITGASAASQLARHVDAGARHLVCRIAAADLPAQREQLARLGELLPGLCTERAPAAA